MKISLKNIIGSPFKNIHSFNSPASGLTEVVEAQPWYKQVYLEQSTWLTPDNLVGWGCPHKWWIDWCLGSRRLGSTRSWSSKFLNSCILNFILQKCINICVLFLLPAYFNLLAALIILSSSRLVSLPILTRIAIPTTPFGDLAAVVWWEYNWPLYPNNWTSRAAWWPPASKIFK